MEHFAWWWILDQLVDRIEHLALSFATGDNLVWVHWNECGARLALARKRLIAA
jgi:hypothetical protein